MVVLLQKQLEVERQLYPSRPTVIALSIFFSLSIGGKDCIRDKTLNNYIHPALACAEAVGNGDKTEAHSWDMAWEKGIVPKLKRAAEHIVGDFSREEPGLL